MNFNEAENLIFEQLPVFSKEGRKAIKIGFNNINKLCDYLGNPQTKFKSIHVAGTNGKGSSCHMLSSIFTKAGYKTGLYTSPHLSDIRERCRIDGKLINEELFIEFVETIQPILPTIQPSYFELNVALAFYAFAKLNVDIAIIETGLGGRLDSTNIIIPELSIITRIALDHTDILGDTLAKIAYEKAGIIKESTPILIGKIQDETQPVFMQKALLMHAPLMYAEEMGSIVKMQLPQNNESYYKYIQSIDQSVYNIETDLLGDFQMENINTVLAAVQILINRGWEKLSMNNAVIALKEVKRLSGLKGRWDFFSKNIVLDVGHNPDGIAQIVNNIQGLKNEPIFIFGAAKDKDVTASVNLLPKNATYFLTNANIPRALKVQELGAIFDKAGLKNYQIDSVAEAVNQALQYKDENQLLIICGSFFIVGEAYKYLENL